MSSGNEFVFGFKACLQPKGMEKAQVQKGTALRLFDLVSIKEFLGISHHREQIPFLRFKI
jgi:hypothetical protein